MPSLIRPGKRRSKYISRAPGVPQQTSKASLVNMKKLNTGNFRKYRSLRRHLITITLKTSYDRKDVLEMFLDNLSANVLQLCDFRHLTYERGAEQCSISSRYFGSIARDKTAPTIVTLEKLCTGFDLTPNDLLISSALQQELAYRQPLPVTQIRCFRFASGLTGFPVCPRCRCTMEREYQSHCDRCGQTLDWRNFDRASLIFPE